MKAKDFQKMLPSIALGAGGFIAGQIVTSQVSKMDFVSKNETIKKFTFLIPAAVGVFLMTTKNKMAAVLGMGMITNSAVNGATKLLPADMKEKWGISGISETPILGRGGYYRPRIGATAESGMREAAKAMFSESEPVNGISTNAMI